MPHDERRLVDIDELLDVLREAAGHPEHCALPKLKKLAQDIRALSADCPQTPSEQLMREGRDER